MSDVYVRLTNEPVARTQSIGDDIAIDFDANDEPIGVEILGSIALELSSPRKS